MSWKIENFKYNDSEGKEEISKILVTDKHGNPIWVHEKDGVEAPIDAKHYFEKIPQLIDEKRQLREKLKQMEADFDEYKDKFDDIEDPKTALKALEIVKNLDDKKLVDAKKVEQLKDQLKEEYDKAIIKEREEAKKAIEELKGQLETEKGNTYNLTVSNSFKGSKVLNGSDALIRVPVDMVEKYWGSNFKTETVDGKLKAVGYYADGKPIFSDVKAGELADFDEAIMKLINVSPFRAEILKGKQQTGGGTGVGDSVQSVKGIVGKDIANYNHLSDFKNDSEKQIFIDKFGLEKYRQIVKNSRNSSSGKGGLSDMGSISK